MDPYDAQAIEAKWQEIWDREHAFEVSNEPVQPKSYVLEQLPYPSGTLHMGHMLVYTIGDVVSRFRRRNGMHVIHPMGWDSFGLPAENAAIRGGDPPRVTVERNIESIRASMKRIGWSYDWTRELSTHDPDYIRWQQWQFLRFFEQGLAYRKPAPVKWCPNDQTVLANEQVTADGRCERCGTLVEVRLMEQWFFRITDYAQELLDDLDRVDYPESIAGRQRNWIGRSEGAEIEFRIEELDEDVPVFTTRPDTLFGATFLVLAPEHELVERIAERSDRAGEIHEYVRRAATKKTEERAAGEDKTGIDTGLHAVNPVNGERLPVFVADYVLTDYGTGAIMAVPAHDTRDFAFAQTYGLPIRHVVRPARRRGRRERGVHRAHGRRGARQLGRLRRHAGSRGRPQDRRAARGRGPREVHDQLPHPRLGLLAAALLGLPDPGRLLRARRDRRRRRRRPADPAARDRGLPAEGPAAARAGRGLGAHHLPEVRRRGAARDRDDGHLRRLVLVLPALLRPAQRGGAVLERGRELLEPGQPVPRRDRPRDDAHDLRAVLDQGPERPRLRRLPRAVRRVLRQRLGDAREPEDVEAGREHRRPRRVRRALRRRRLPAEHHVPGPGRPGHGVDRGQRRGDGALRPPAVARSCTR